MALPLDKLGTTYGPTTTVIEADPGRAYAAATDDANPTVYASEATSHGAAVVKHGLAEVV